MVKAKAMFSADSNIDCKLPLLLVQQVFRPAVDISNKNTRR